MTVTFLRYKNKIVRCKCNGRKPCCAFSSHQTGIPPLPASPAPMWRSSERSRARGFFFFVALCLSCSTQGVLGFAYPAIHLQRSALRQKSHSSVLQLRSQISPFAAPEHITSAASFHATSTLFAGEGGHKDARVIQTRTTRLVGLNLLSIAGARAASRQLALGWRQRLPALASPPGLRRHLHPPLHNRVPQAGHLPSASVAQSPTMTWRAEAGRVTSHCYRRRSPLPSTLKADCENHPVRHAGACI
eukprot:3221783-Rhodomonas_salina.2